jgi:DNA polymerase III epsilon subunit-like protein
MCGANFNRSELILLSVVDFFTAEVLINSLVKPSVPVMSWRTQYSGVSENMMREAVAAGNYIDGWQGARALLFQYIDTDTIIMGHSLHYDLDQLRLIHQKVIDSSMLIPKLKSSKHGVQGLSAELFRKQVQRGGRYGHDCLEDTLATRELIIWCLRNPVDFVARKMQSDKERAQAEAEYLLKIEKRAECEGLSKEQQEIRGDTREAVGKENSGYQEETMKTFTGAN